MTKLRLLIADASSDFRRNVRAMLADERNFDIIALARDGFEALEIARKLQPDVAVLDLHMPGMNGLETMQALARVSPRTRCLIMSVDRAYGHVDAMRKAGAPEYLVKPFSVEEFIAAVRRVVAATPYVTGDRLGNEPPLNQPLVLTLLKTGRMDDEAARAYLEYIHHPNAQPETLARLAEIFCARREWKHLRHICGKMEAAEAGR
ncbi:MAG: response regulator [Anaerolineales bacterium]|nr:response regulator [Anaerolineales bacterium]